ncbi:MAG: SMI1/KNR4 family protein, partial [Clostridiales bacterium]|nr:SMI1/KNR4 family protein [Clostridiales bacterium]
MFERFDFTDFWQTEEFTDWDDYRGPLPSDELIAELEKELGYKLPESYIWLMKQHNG